MQPWTPCSSSPPCPTPRRAGPCRALVELRLAACVNILAPCQSVYRWEGKLEDAEEVPLLIKTTAARYAALEEAIRAYHPYELPEIVGCPNRQGPARLPGLGGGRNRRPITSTRT
jgi:uncharacterized protein involved in tolerance to divalent cations